jgi:hypothetical protein
VLKSPNTWHDSQALLAHHGFARFQPFLAARAMQEFGDAPVQNGAAAKAILAGDALLSLRAEEKSTLTQAVQWHELAAPVEKGQTIGELAYFAGGQKVAALPLVAQDDVPVSVLPLALAAAPRLLQWNEWSVFSVVRVPSSWTQWTMPALLFVSLMLLWSGLKQPHEKRQQPAPRRRQKPNEKPSRGRDTASHRLATEQAENTSRPAPGSYAPNRTAPEIEQRRPGGNGSLQTRRQHTRAGAKQPPRQPCVGEQFVTHFLNEETESRAHRADSEFTRESQ